MIGGARRAAVGALVAGVLLGGTALARTAGVATAVEGWHELSPLSPLPAPPREFPEDTLHIGVDVGRETAQTFLSFELTSLPAGAAIDGGTLTLPVAGADAGTSNPQTAEMVACLLTEPPVAVERGAAEERPAFDCATSSPAVFQDEGGKQAFSVDLAPLGALWSAGTVNHGVALVPTPEGRNPIASWRIALYAKESTAPGAAPVTATVSYPDSSAAPAPPAQAAAPPAPAPATATPPLPPGAFAPALLPSVPQESGLTAATSLPPELLAGAVGAPPPPAVGVTTPLPVAAPAGAPAGPLGGFETVSIEPFLRAYPIAWVLPLAVAMLAATLGTSLARPVPVSTGSTSLMRDLFFGPRSGPAAG